MLGRAKRRISFGSVDDPADDRAGAQSIGPAVPEDVHMTEGIEPMIQEDEPMVHETVHITQQQENVPPQDNGEAAMPPPPLRRCIRGPMIEGLDQHVRRMISIDGTIIAATTAGSTTLLPQ